MGQSWLITSNLSPFCWYENPTTFRRSQSHPARDFIFHPPLQLSVSMWLNFGHWYMKMNLCNFWITPLKKEDVGFIASFPFATGCDLMRTGAAALCEWQHCPANRTSGLFYERAINLYNFIYKRETDIILYILYVQYNNLFIERSLSYSKLAYSLLNSGRAVVYGCSRQMDKSIKE